MEAASAVPAAPLNLGDNIPQLEIAAMLRWGGALAGIRVDEAALFGISAFFRGVEVIAGQLSTLPFVSYRSGDGGRRESVKSIFDNPDPDGQTLPEWKYSLVANLLIYGRAGCLKIRNNAGGLIALPIVHPDHFTVRIPTPAERAAGDRPRGGLYFDVTMDDATVKRCDAEDFWYLPGLSLDGKTTLSLIDFAAASMQTTIAADQATGRMFVSGAMISGLATPADEEDIESDVPEIRRQINNAMTGPDNAGGIAVIARRLNFTPWQMTAQGAQFLEMRQFQIEEAARWLGVPPHLLMQTEKQTSWGTGVEMQDRALGRTVLNRWATLVEARGSRLLAEPRWLEVDFSMLERPTPEKEVELDLAQVAAGVMTVDEYRIKRGWKPLAVEPQAGPGDDVDDDADGGAGDA